MMDKYIGQVGEKFEVEVQLVNIYEYTKSFSYFNEDAYIYTMKDNEGRVIVWKTGKWMSIKIEGSKNDHSEIDSEGNYWKYTPINKGDKIVLAGTIKELGEYKGNPQTVVTRCKVKKVINHVLTKEESIKKRREEQLSSLEDGDYTWRIPYKQYKERYADCETVAGSFKEGKLRGLTYLPSTIEVIIRNGRLKPSGVRFQHFSGYELWSNQGRRVVYKAVSEDNAIKRAQKEFPGEKWECAKIYR